MFSNLYVGLYSTYAVKKTESFIFSVNLARDLKREKVLNGKR